MAYTLNDLAAVAPVLLREGLMALRENSIMAAMCQFDVAKEAAQKGAIINVQIPPVIPAQEVNVSSPNSPTVLEPTVVPIVLDKWYESVFSMSDKDLTEVKSGLMPAAASEAVKSLANLVDISALGLYKDIYGFSGVAGDTPDAIGDLTAARKTLNSQLAPLSNRAMVIDVEAEAKLLELDLFIAAEKVGNTEALREGSLGRKMGFDIHMDQNVLDHTKGTAVAGTSIALSAATAVGDTTIAVDDSGSISLAGTFVQGDLLTIAGVAQTYVVTADVTAAANAATIAISPPIGEIIADGTIVTLVDSHTVNLAFNKQAFCFVSRPLEVMSGLGSIVESISDPISGITLRLEITRENKQMKWAYDILWGVKTVRAQLATRMLG